MWEQTGIAGRRRAIGTSAEAGSRTLNESASLVIRDQIPALCGSVLRSEAT